MSDWVSTGRKPGCPQTVNPDYTQRPDPSELPPVLDRLNASKAA
jgi:hypothetical protein